MTQRNILFSTHPLADSGAAEAGLAGLILLDRPRALNALSYDMAVALKEQLEQWGEDGAISHVVIAGSEPRAFCAGGDVRDLYEFIQRGEHPRTHTYFRAEYLADLAVFEFPKPIIALADGVVMGGGAGLMQCSSHAVVSDRTRFAMPESAIGLFPDAGASIFLGRCPRPLALLMGLTGRIIGAADCMMLGLASATIASDRMDDLRDALLACTSDRIDDVIASFRMDPGAALLQQNRAVIDYVFQGSDLSVMRDRAGDLARLKGDDFAAELHDALSTKCPMTMHVFMRLIDMGDAIPDMPTALELDYRLAIRMTERADFSDGIRAVLVDKTNDATWDPARLEDVTSDMVDAVFDHAGLPALR